MSLQLSGIGDTRIRSGGHLTALAVALRDSLGHVTAVDYGETTLSEEDRQFVRTRIWCDARLSDQIRCPLPADHDGPCGG
ncbi:hypothetical protein ACFFMM_26105 [Micromonospora chaiyaphumensis]|nr:hypothetical protein [Micromonospora chaiyaphumensis]